MIRSYCFDTEKDWDEGIHILLFAVRESVQESQYRSIRPQGSWTFKTVKREISSQEDTPLNLLQYVSDFQSKLLTACGAAKSNLLEVK